MPGMMRGKKKPMRMMRGGAAKKKMMRGGMAKKKKKSQKTPKTRNWVAVQAHFRTGAGAHSPNKYTRKQKHKTVYQGDQ